MKVTKVIGLGSRRGHKAAYGQSVNGEALAQLSDFDLHNAPPSKRQIQMIRTEFTVAATIIPCPIA